MNYLAHFFLADGYADLTIGNYIADSVRGKQFDEYDDAVKQGIYLHRQIDTYTDNHPDFANSRKRLYETHGKYAGVIADVFYDHFLAKNWSNFHSESLENFASGKYRLLEANIHLLPERSQRFLTYMVRNNILYQYRLLEGINQALTGLAYRASFDSGMENAVDQLKQNFDLFEADFNSFFPEMISFVNMEMKKLL